MAPVDWPGFLGWLMGGAQRRRVGCRSCMGSGVCIIYVWCAYKSPHKCRHPPSTYCSPGLFKTSPFVDTGTSTSEIFIGIIIMFKEFSIEITSCTINNIYLSIYLYIICHSVLLHSNFLCENHEHFVTKSRCLPLCVILVLIYVIISHLEVCDAVCLT